MRRPARKTDLHLYRWFVLLLLFFQWAQGSAQNYSVDWYLDKIERLQSTSDSFYSIGMFPSERYFNNPVKVKQDNNVYFSALIAYNLQVCMPYFTDAQASKANEITEGIRANYSLYANRNGEITYNFWRTRPEQYFPNHALFSRTERFRLADDLDDTSILYLTKDHGDSLNRELKQKMIRHTNLYRKRIYTTFPRYRDIRAYDSWFGEKMANEFDVCIVSNVLLFVFEKDLPMNRYDSASVFLIEETLRHDDHLKNPYIVSPWYQNSAIIIYHFARLVSKADGRLNHLKAKLTSDIRQLLLSKPNKTEELLLHIALLRIGILPEREIDLHALPSEFEQFAFFRVYMFSQSPLWLKLLAGGSGRFDFKFRSEAYYYSLILEYLCLRGTFEQG